MQDRIGERVLTEAAYIADSGATVRDAAAKYGISKSTVHKDMTERLFPLSPQLAGRVYDVLAWNKAQRHIRGGEATRKKYRGDSEE